MAMGTEIGGRKSRWQRIKFLIFHKIIYPLSRMNNNAENNADGQPEYSLFMNKGQRVDAVYYLTKKRVILFLI